ncbi:MAG: IclR family transcriptional regulator [Gammaproteobacteria bacterium]|nr:IclR family transcriptional regulator [Gammaproteobacteria bacterium]
MQAQKTEHAMVDEASALTAPEEDDKPSVKSIDRAATILQVLATFGAEGAPLTEVARLSGFGKATTHRLLAALSEVGFASQHTGSRHYHLGARLALLSRQAGQIDVAALAKPSLEHLASVTEDTAYVSVREGIRSLCLGREQGAFPIKTLSLDVGVSRPLGVGSGSLAILAFMPEAEIEAAIESNARWLLDFPAFTPTRLRALVRQTQAQGFAFIEGLIIPGVNAVGVPVYDAQKRPVAALSITAIADRVHGERTLKLASLLHAEANEVAAVMQRQASLRPAGARA